MQILRILGAGVRAQVVMDLIAWQFHDRYMLNGFYDDQKPVGSQGPGGYPILGTVDQGCQEIARQGGVVAFIALGTRNSWRSCAVLMQLRRDRVPIASFISPEAHVSPSARIGDNALITPGVYIGAGVRVGDLFTAHGGSTVEHHGTVRHNVLLGPGVSLASSVMVGSHTFFGAGASVIPEIQIGEGTMVGAGSVVIQNLPLHVVACGCPTRIIRETVVGDEVPTKHQIDMLSTQGFGN